MGDEPSVHDNSRIQEEKINKLKALVIREKKLNVELNGKLTSSNSQVEKLQSENDQLISQIQRLSSTVGELQDNQLSSTELQAKIKQLEDETARNNEHDTFLKTNLKAEIQTLEEKLLASNAIIDELKSNLIISKLNGEELSARLAEKTSNLDHLQVLNGDMEASMKEIEIQLAKNTENSNVKLDEFKSIISTMENKLTSYTDLIEQFHELESERDLTKASLHKAEEALCIMESDRNNVKNTIYELECKLSNLQCEEKNKKKSCAVSSVEIFTQTDALDSTTYTTEGVTMDCEQLKIKSLEDQISTLENSIDHLRANKTKEIVNLSSSVENQEKMNNTNSTDNKNFEDFENSKIKDLEEQISFLNDKIKQLHTEKEKNSNSCLHEKLTDTWSLLPDFSKALISLTEGNDGHVSMESFVKNSAISEFIQPIITAVEELYKTNANFKVTNTVLQDGMSSLTLKCSELEELLMNSSESLKKSESIIKEERASHQVIIDNFEKELESSKQKLQRMEDLVEDNRNIARALENEKDALQVEMTELRTRTEEKEAYLVEEAREAKQGLENMEIQLHSISESREIEVHSLKEERQILKHELDLLQIEIDRKDNELKDITNEKDSLVMEIEGVTSDITEKEALQENTIANLRNKLTCKTVELKELSTKFDDIETQLKEVTLSNNAYLSENNNLRESLELVQKMLTSSQAELDSISELKALVDSQKVFIENVNLELRVLKEENNGLRNDLSDLMNQQKSFSEDLELKEHRIVELSSHSSTNLELTDERDQLLKEQTKMKTLLEEFPLKLKECESESLTLKEEVARLQASIEIVSASLEDSRLKHVMELQQKEEEYKKLSLSFAEFESQYSTMMSSLQSEIAAEKLKMEHIISQKNSLEQIMSATNQKLQIDLSDLKEHLANKEKAATILQEELDKALKTARQSTVMDLELAEFEKTLSSLRDQLDAKEEQVRQLESELSSKESQFCQLRSQLKDAEHVKGQSEDRANKMKQILMKTKKELSEVQKSTSNQKCRESQITAEVETLTSQIENLKIQLAQVAAEKYKMEDRIMQIKSINETAVKSKEHMISNLREDLNKTKEDKGALKEEFNAYKIKAQKALKELKEPRPILTGVSLEEIRVRNDRLESVVDQLKVKLEAKESNLTAALGEVMDYQREVDRLEDRNKKLLIDLQAKEHQWQERFDRLTTDNSAHESVSMETIKQLSAENDILAAAFKEQIVAIKREHEESKTSLRLELENSESEVQQLNEEVWKLRNQLAAAANSFQNTSLAVKQESSGSKQISSTATPVPSVNATNTNHHQIAPLQERQDGEGMEHPIESPRSDLDSVGSSLTLPPPSRVHNSGIIPISSYKSTSYLGPIPLDQLLDVRGTGAPDLDQTDAESTTSTTSIMGGPSKALQQLQAVVEGLRQECASKQKQNDHLSELITDSEAMVAHLTEQAKVLKEEIRRHERNAQRDENLLVENPTNNEYLKNIVLKFLYLRPGQERLQLVAVLTTLLSLSGEERTMLVKVAEGDKDQSPEAQGWANYFSWAGMS